MKLWVRAWQGEGEPNWWCEMVLVNPRKKAIRRPYSDRNHIVRGDDSAKTVCGLAVGPLSEGVEDARLCQRCAGLVTADGFQPGTYNWHRWEDRWGDLTPVIRTW